MTRLIGPDYGCDAIALADLTKSILLASLLQTMNQSKAIEFIEKHGVLLVFPMNNQKQPKSLWSEFYPRTKMKWEWDNDGDRRVEKLWRLMKTLSDSREVVYSKWYRGRATFFSKDLFTALLKLKQLGQAYPHSRTAKEILDILIEDSPLSTKQLKALTGLKGRDNEPLYTKAMKELFTNFDVVAFGEVDDGAFPSLAVGATKSLYEDLFSAAAKMTSKQAGSLVGKFMPDDSAFGKFLAANR